MNIRYKLIEHERVGDAPFIGALICAVDCEFHCANCFNQGLKQLPTKNRDVSEIIFEVRNNPFNRGIILGGLEWTLQREEAIALVKEAANHGLLSMLYTGSDQIDQEFYSHFNYVKIGRYDPSQHKYHSEYGVTLATENQHILINGIDF